MEESLVRTIISTTIGYVAPEMTDLISEIVSGDAASWDCCPLCEETVCDESCPLYAIRLAKSPVLFPAQVVK